MAESSTHPDVTTTHILALGHGDRVNRMLFEANLVQQRGQHPVARFVINPHNGHVVGVELVAEERVQS